MILRNIRSGISYGTVGEEVEFYNYSGEHIMNCHIGDMYKVAFKDFNGKPQTKEFMVVKAEHNSSPILYGLGELYETEEVLEKTASYEELKEGKEYAKLVVVND